MKDNLREQAKQAITFVHELSMGAYKPEEIEFVALKIAKMAPLQDLMDADKVDAQPVAPELHLLAEAHKYWKHANAKHYGAVQWIDNHETGELLIYTRGEYRKTLMRNIEDTTAPVAAQPDPAMAGDEWLKQFDKYVGLLISSGADVMEATTETERELRAAHRQAIEAIRTHVRKRVQPASGKTLWYPDNGNWVEVTPGCKMSNTKLAGEELIDVMISDNREERKWFSYPKPAHWWTWGKIVAYKVVG